jgi:uridylate kinase
VEGLAGDLIHFPLTRCLVKLSGELLGGQQKTGIDLAALERLAGEIRGVRERVAGVQVAVVVGGGNFIRGAAFSKGAVGRVTADTMGMLATVMNAMALQDVLEQAGVPCRLQTSFEIRPAGEPFTRRRAIRHLEQGRVVIFAGGTGNPYFSTDTAAVLRASEIDAAAVLKGTKVDGVYDKDPARHADAVRFESIRLEEALERKLGVMDAAAFALCMEKRIPVIVYDSSVEGNLVRAVLGEKVGTIVY